MVLRQMVETGATGPREAEGAMAAPQAKGALEGPTDGVESQEEVSSPSSVIPVSKSSLEPLPLERNPTAIPLFEGIESGRLRIQTEPPGLAVFIDGKSVGVSPLSLSVPVGEHTLKVVPPPGTPSVERSVQVKSGATETLNIRY